MRPSWINQQSPEAISPVLRKNKREVRIADYVASQVVPMLSRMFERRRVGYRAMGYRKDNSGTLFQ
jgi:hypothetical protein